MFMLIILGFLNRQSLLVSLEHGYIEEVKRDEVGEFVGYIAAMF